MYMIGPRQNCNKSFLYRIIFYNVLKAPEKKFTQFYLAEPSAF